MILTVITLVALSAGLVVVTSAVVVRNSVRNQLVEDALARAEFNIAVLAAPDQLPADAGRREFGDTRMMDRFLLRGTDGVFVEFDDGEVAVSSLGLLAAEEAISADLREVMTRGEYAIEFVTFNDLPTLVVGARRPPSGPDFFFFSSAEEAERATDQLVEVLLTAGLVVVAIGALAAGIIARRLLRPVGEAGRAAERMAGGNLGVRVPAGGPDELGRLADAFNRMASSLQSRMEELTEGRERERRFVADVSHELRTPLTALVNEAAMVEQQLSDLSESGAMVGRLLVADVERLRALVEDLLEISRLDSRATEPDLSDIDVVPFMRAVVAARNPAASLTVDPGVEWIRSDRRSLERVVGNLLDNTASHAAGSVVAVEVRREGTDLVVVVSDDGPGVAPEVIPHIFDRFFKADASRQGGSGLGLAIARQHARRLGGELTVVPGSSGGLVFELQVPVTEPLHRRDGGATSVLDPDGVRRSDPKEQP